MDRVRRFVEMYGWRAYAIPILVVVTLLALFDATRADSVAQDPRDAMTTPGTGSGEPDVPASTTAATTAAATTPPAPTTTAAPVLTEGAEPTDTVAPATFVQRGEGTLSVVPGQSAVLGQGPLLRFRVEIEDGINVDGPAFARAVEATLGDPRSWGAGGRQSFQRVGAAGPFDFRVSLVSPDNVNDFCGGLDTGGYTSCRSGDRAVINLARWETAVPEYGGDLATYRQYVVNHEVGHYLGHGHEPCPGPGERAPVMQQQTLGLDGCTKNAWPFP